MQIGFLYAIGAAVTWGLVYCIDQKVLHGLSSFDLLLIDSIITALIALPFVVFDSKLWKDVGTITPPNFLLIILSITLALVANFLIFSGIKVLDASVASMIEIAYPFFVVLFSYIFFHSKPNLYFFAGGLLIFLGSIIIIKFA